MARMGSIEVSKVAGNTVYRFTPVGLEEFKQRARVGTPATEMAAWFGVSPDWIERQIKANDYAGDAFREAEADGRFELRQKLHELATAGDTKALLFAAERRLGMRKEVQVNHAGTVKLVGTRPDWKQSVEDWSEQYIPKDVTPAMPQLAKLSADDAEVVEVDDGRGAAGGGSGGGGGDGFAQPGGRGECDVPAPVPASAGDEAKPLDPTGRLHEARGGGEVALGKAGEGPSRGAGRGRRRTGSRSAK